MEATKLYQSIFHWIRNKNYFVITTNVDSQFLKAGFNPKNVFEVQGSYRYIQCSNACHNILYEDEKLVNTMLSQIKDCKIPTELVPKCPRCGKPMVPNLRKDANFVQDDRWYQQNEVYYQFIEKTKERKVVLLEFGAGFNTPGIIRYPFEEMTSQNKEWKLIRFNKEYPEAWIELGEKIIEIQEDINEVIQKLIEG